MKKRELLKMIEETGSKYIRLSNEEGEIVVPQNSPKYNIEARCESIEKVLKPDSIYPDGLYYIELRPSSAGHPVKFKFYKGTEKSLSEPEKKSTAPVVLHSDNARFDAIEKRLETLCDLLENDPGPEPINDMPAPPTGTNLNDVLISYAPLADNLLKTFTEGLKQQQSPQQQQQQQPNDKKQISNFIASLLGELYIAKSDYDLIEAYLESLKQVDPVICTNVCAILNNHASETTS